ncbi:hypothetical protein HZ326_30754 [Fusarium oxysporum f. sp. albedinis]|nr:hypothetical protein HZ326_30754 [Fusarium oxysporum f. sp. albedinis]
MKRCIVRACSWLGLVSREVCWVPWPTRTCEYFLSGTMRLNAYSCNQLQNSDEYEPKGSDTEIILPFPQGEAARRL